MIKPLLLWLPVLFLSCGTPEGKSVRTIGNSGDGYPLREYEIEGCQYIGSLDMASASTLAHKGSCKNPIHKCPCNSVDSLLVAPDTVPVIKLKISE